MSKWKKVKLGDICEITSSKRIFAREYTKSSIPFYRGKEITEKLKQENLRDHMNDLELIFTMLGEAATTEIATNTDAQGLPQNKVTARKGGSVAGKARKDLEKKTNKKVSTKKNYLPESTKSKKLK